MNVASDEELEDVEMLWVESARTRGVRLPDGPEHLLPVRGTLQTINPRIVIRIAEGTLSGIGGGWDCGHFSYDPDDLDGWNGVVVKIPEDAPANPEHSKLFVSREAWRRLVIRLVQLFVDHPNPNDHTYDAKLAELLAQLRDQ